MEKETKEHKKRRFDARLEKISIHPGCVCAVPDQHQNPTNEKGKDEGAGSEVTQHNEM